MATIGKVSREDFRKQKELDEARKAGTAPAEVDEEGRLVHTLSLVSHTLSTRPHRVPRRWQSSPYVGVIQPI